MVSAVLVQTPSPLYIPIIPEAPLQDSLHPAVGAGYLVVGNFWVAVKELKLSYHNVNNSVSPIW